MSNNIHEFKIDKNILYSIISKQAGTLQKAFLELVMNSIDAGATEIKMEFDGLNFSFFDNGKGFESEEDIHKFFGTFGTPHKEGDAIYGKFRMGRGQIMAFSQNNWKSNKFSMDVDIKNRGINYNFKSNEPFINGCLITGKLYSELESHEIKQFETEFMEFIKFSQVPVYYNNKCVSENISSIKWDRENEYGYIKIDNNKRDLSVYNLGVKVVDYRSHEMGFGGIIVSKKPIEVNFARNDILRKSCNTWKALYKEINSILLTKSKESIDEYKTLDESQRASLSKKLITGELDYMVGRKLKLFKDIKGIYHTVSKIATLEVVAVTDRYNRLADKVHEEKRAFVFDAEVLENFGVENLQELYKSLGKICYENGLKNCDYLTREYNLISSEHDKLYRDRIFIDDINIFEEKIDINHIILKEKDLNPQQNLVMETINKHENKIRKLIDKFTRTENKIKKREIKAGSSGIADAWTNGNSFIAVNRENLIVTNGTANFIKICNLLLHEYLHDDNDMRSHIHNAEFYEMYHRISQHQYTTYKCRYSEGYYRENRKDSLGYIAQAMTKTYIGLLEKHKLRIPKGMLTLSSKTYRQLYGYKEG